MKVITTKVYKTIDLFKKLQGKILLITIYKAFVRPDLDCDDMIYDEAYNKIFQHKLESIQYNACLALLAAIRALSR